MRRDNVCQRGRKGPVVDLLHDVVGDEVRAAREEVGVARLGVSVGEPGLQIALGVGLAA